MITNRAVDYMIDGNVSLRQIYEYKSKLSPLAQSKFSNHLALIGMIVLNDDYVLFPHRTTKSTISKNMITSGIAVPFKLDQADVNLSCDETETPFEDFIFDGLASAMKIKRSDLKRYNVKIQLIGVGRDVYEGGKPSFFYQIRIDDMSSDDYLSKTRAYLSNSSKEENLDSNKRIYVVKFKSLVWHKDKSLLTFKAKVRPGKILKHKLCLRPEKNLLANLYHYIKFNECK